MTSTDPPEKDVVTRLATSNKPPLKNVSGNFFFEKIYTSSSLPIKEDRPLIFDISGLSGHQVDYSLLKLFLAVRVVQENGDPLSREENVVFKSAPLYTLFSDLTLLWNNNTVFTSHGLYPFYANILLQLKLPEILRETAGYYNDFQHLDPTWPPPPAPGAAAAAAKADKQKGWTGRDVVPNWVQRFSKNRLSEFCEFGGLLLNDLAFQKKYSRDDIDSRVILTPSKGGFSLFSNQLNKRYKVEIHSAYLQVPRMELLGSYAPSRGKIDYYFVENNLTYHVIRKDAFTINRPLLNGPIPR